ncbi:MAG TPA: sigma-70 family RNA polymerase sigma factor [Gemmataceae bacterium]|jgi:RNA polymerase sigma factor (sigma-70 family)|nr:sigma-70 family RNA polymerase sigma factor [Gemmataceae bacterium]
MVNAQLHGVLRYLQSLRDTQALTEAPDAQLLEWFARGHEEGPFAALVRRHGPMVWSVSRRVLPHVHDAEDVFQATFLLLARKAESIRKAESVGSWLHGVAYRLALKARVQQARRQSREKRAVDMRPTRPSGETSMSEVQAALDAALGELPEKYHAALVLCYLEGKTQEEAARHLGCPLATVRTRVARGRKLLRDRLAKQGLTLSTAGLAALLIASAAPATAPAALVKAAVQAAPPFAAGQAAAALCSKQAAGLIEGGLRAMFLTKVKTATALLLAASLVTAAAALTKRVTAAHDAAKAPAATSAKPQAAEGKRAAAKEVKPPAAGDKDAIAYGGRVLGPDGRPVTGAKLYMTLEGGYDWQLAPSPEYATTGRDGRFKFTVPKAQFGEQVTVVTATGANHGAGWVEVPKDGKRDDLTLQLVKDDMPIAGQIVDLEGKPVPGATLRVLQINAGPKENLGPWLEAAKGKRGLTFQLENQYLSRYSIAPSPKVTTDAAGRFRLTGIGRNRLVMAQLDGPTIVSQYLHILTRPGEAIKVLEHEGHSEYGKQGIFTTYYAASFRHVAAPCKPIAGVVRDNETKKPLAGISIRSHTLATRPNYLQDIVRTTTDARGRYRLVGMPKGEGNKIVAIPGTDQPYVVSAKGVADSPGLDPATVDFELKRGVWIEGKITDKVTGKPLQAAVEYFSLYSNPNLRDYPGFDSAVVFRSVGTKEDGSYRVVGIPGPGLVAVWQVDHYVRAPERDDEYGIKERSLSTAPYQLLPLVDYGAVARIDPAKGVDSVKQAVTLEPGWTFTGTVHGPDGKTLAGARSFGLTGWGDWEHEAMKSAKFTVREFNPHRPRAILFQHLGKGLVGVAQPPKATGGSVTVRMQPGATVTGRLLDGDGQPRAGVELEVLFRLKGEPGRQTYRPERIKTDRAGRFCIEALLPCYEYSLSDGKGDLHFGKTLGAGETKNLGDVQTRRE